MLWLFLLQADSQMSKDRQVFYDASLQYVFKIQEVQERKKFEFVEPVSSQICIHYYNFCYHYMFLCCFCASEKCIFMLGYRFNCSTWCLVSVSSFPPAESCVHADKIMERQLHATNSIWPVIKMFYWYISVKPTSCCCCSSSCSETSSVGQRGKLFVVK